MMKSLQTYLIIIVLFFGSHLSAKAEDCCKNWLYIEFETEIQPLSGGSLALNFTVNDTLDGSETVNIDSLWYFVVNNEGLNVSSNTFNVGNYNTGSQQNHTLTVNYDPGMPPFYLQELRMYVKVNGVVQMHIAYIHFTAWETIEVYSESTLPVQDRSWITPLEGEEPVRVAINPDTLPTELPDTTLPICWKQIDGLAYSLPINCDTTAEEGSGEEQNLFGTTICGPRTYRGRAVGRVTYDYFNDEGSWEVLPIANARVEAWSGIRVGVGSTDANGNFNFNFDKFMPLTIAPTCRILVNLRVISKDNNGKVIVHSNIAVFNTAYELETSKKSFSHNSGNRHDLNFGRVNAGHHRNLHIFHWSRRAIDFARSELSVLPSIPWAKLKVYVRPNPINSGRCYFERDILQAPQQGKVRLTAPRCLISESTSYHEVGHFVQYAIQGFDWLQNTTGTHTFLRNNKHPNQTITEGFANAFAFIVDARYYTDDNESFQYRNVPVHPLNADDFQFSVWGTTHPFTNEFIFAKSVLDLWDGVNKLEGYGALLDINEEIEVEDYGNDELSLQFATLCLPFYNQTSLVEDVPGYFNRLLDYLPNCDDRSKVKSIADANFRHDDPGDYVGPGEVFQINTDAISRNLYTQHRNDALEGGTPFPYWYNYNQSTGNEVDQSILNTVGESYNIALGLNAPHNLTDNLIVQDGASLFFNANIPVGWVSNNSSIRPPNPSQLNSTLCGIELVIDDQGEVVIGDGVVDCTAEVLATNDSRVIIRDGGTLIIRNNSKLIIDSDSRIRFENGASIVLDGPDAVLEVKGRIEIGNNATFTYTGDGYLKTEFYPCLNCDNIIAGTGSKIHLEGSGMSDKILEVADYTHFEPDASVTDFALLNGLVEMGKNSVLHVRGAIPNFQYLKVTAIDPNHPFDQIMLNGNPQHTFQNMEISYADKGINDRQIYGGGGLNLSYVDISHCNYGIYTNGSGGRLTNCNITDNAIAGWQMSVGGSGYQSWVKSSTFTDNYFGIHYLSGGSNLYLEHSYFASNILGVYFKGSGSLTGKCSRITNNTVEGISMWNQSTLDFSNNSFMRVENNGSYNIAFNLLRNIYLEDGNNKFLPNNGLMSMSGYIEANSPSLMGTNTIQANNNHWNSSGTSPVSGVDYSLKVQNLQPDTRYINDNNPVLFDYQNCITQVPEPEVFLLGSEDSLESSTTTMKNNNIKINTAHFSNKTIREAILETKSIQSQKKHNGMDVMQKNKHVLELYRQILTEPIDDQNSDLSYLQTYAYGEMKKLFGEVIDSIIYTNKGDTIIIDSLSEKLREVIDTLSMPHYNTGHTYQEKFYYDVERALLYRRIGKINVADSLLTETKKYVASTDSAYLYDLSCRISLENELISNIIDYETYLQGIENCGITNTKSNRKKIISTDESNQKYTFSVFPNPTNGLVKIMSKAFENESVDLRVYSSTGQLVYSISFNAIDKESVKTIDLSELTSGVYILNLQSNSFVESEIIVIN